MHNRHPAFVLGMFETGLAVARSLGRKGIRVTGFDFKKDIGFYSRYTKGYVCPHPVDEERLFVNFLISLAQSQECKPVLFVTSDDFLTALARSRSAIERYFLMNLPDSAIMHSVTDKFLQYKLARKLGISCPVTYCVKSVREVEQLKAKLPYPVFVKAQDVTEWRRRISGTTKGYVVNNGDELAAKAKGVIEKGLKIIIQEVVGGPDTNHYKICCYVSRNGEFLLVFTLQKLRQLPVHFGVGSAVMSIDYPELVEIGVEFFMNIGYRGVGSAEFKLDEKDGKLKLIELNPRYWQQNSLAEKCGMNFPIVDYMEATGQNPNPIHEFRRNIEWTNIYMDLASFLEYRKRKQITFGAWLNSIKRVRVLSDFSLDDPLPVFYESRFGIRMLRIPRYFLKKFRNGNN